MRKHDPDTLGVPKIRLRFESDDAPDTSLNTSGQNVQRLKSKLKTDDERLSPTNRLRWENSLNREADSNTFDVVDESTDEDMETSDEASIDDSDDSAIDDDDKAQPDPDGNDDPITFADEDSGDIHFDPIDEDILSEYTTDGDLSSPTDKKTVRDNKRLSKLDTRVEKSGGKLESAREKLANQKPVKKPGVIKTAGHAAGVETWKFVHGKLHQVEHENVGVKAAHRIELAGETVLRGGTRFIKKRIRTRPIRRVRKWERKNVKANTNHAFRQMVQEHPELKKSAAARHAQKKRIKKHYQKKTHEAAKAAKKAAEKTAVTTEKTAKSVVKFVRRHPIGSLIALLVILLVVLLHSCVGMVTSVGNGTIGAIGAGTYQPEDTEMIAAEAAYAGMESALQYELDNYASLHSGYDEYHYDFDAIAHDPYALISLLSAWYEGAWTLTEVQETLTMLFEHQYTLIETVTVEVRSYTETEILIDPITGVITTLSYEVEYNYYICNASMENFNLSHLPMFVMSEEKLGQYALYMSTHGNRPDLFPNSLYPHASTASEYTYYGIPPEYLSDEVFAAMITEAEKYLGYPYVFGGSSPVTSFDCSGFVSWVINHSGWDVGRLGAKGLYNICTPVSATNAKPGDLIFFHTTYDAPDPTAATHVGIYVGDNMMLHCGSPISYTSITTNYWQAHFFGFGRLPS